jgi:hypothetical protein
LADPAQHSIKKDFVYFEIGIKFDYIPKEGKFYQYQQEDKIIL